MPADMSLVDLLGTIAGFILTILVFSYLVGDNPLFRFAVHLFIGVATGFAAAVIIHNVILDQLIFPLFYQRQAAYLLLTPPLLLGAWMLAKISPRMAFLGNPVMGYLVGAGAAAAIGGAILGTLFPQANASTNLLNVRLALQAGVNPGGYLLNGIIILIGSVGTLVYFHFGARQSLGQPAQRHPLIDELGRIGQVFIAVTFGTLFAGVYVAAFTALIERVSFLISFIRNFLTL